MNSSSRALTSRIVSEGKSRWRFGLVRLNYGIHLQMAYVLLALGAVGHVILWVALVNRVHALGIKRRWVDLLTILCGLCVAGLPVAVLGAFVAISVASRITVPLMVANGAAELRARVRRGLPDGGDSAVAVVAPRGAP